MTRVSARYRVHLTVRYTTAVEFVREYAENLSNSGLFINGGHDLQPLTQVNVEVTLPGAGAFMLKCEVAHVMTPELATKYGRSPGAGLAILKAPDGFEDALVSYLHRLGRRADHRVLGLDAELLKVISETGYKTGPAPTAAGLAEALVHTDDPIVAVVVPRESERLYRAAASALGAGDVVVVMDHEAELDTVLGVLDQRM